MLADIFKTMIMTVRELRAQISKLLNEMPYVGRSQMVDVPNTNGSLRTDDNAQVSKKQLQRYFDAPAFDQKATRLFNKLSVPIFIVPAFEHRGWNEDRNKELATIPASIVRQMSTGLSERLQDLVKNGGSVWIVAADKLRSGVIPSPWMCVHALIDDPRNGNRFSTRSENSDESLREACDRLSDMGKLRLAIAGLTMKSARDGVLREPNDVYAELYTQAILDSRGFTHRTSDDPDVSEFYRISENELKNARHVFETRISGRVYLIQGYAG